MIKFSKLSIFILILPIILSSCKGPDGKFKLPGGDARKFPADPAKRVEQNLKQGKGFQLNDAFGGGKKVEYLTLQVPMRYGEPHLML